MRKVLAFLAASLVVAVAGPVKAQDPQAPDMFKDLDRNHWAYEAVESLRSKGIVVGYPDGYFRGKRTLTRYEFAVALDRALRKLNIQGTPGPQGPPGETGPAGPQGQIGPPGVTPDELATLRRLLQEFRDELAALGNNMRAIQDRVDRLARDVASIQDQLNRMPKIHGGAFVGFRSDVVHGAYVDRNGIVDPLNNQQAVVHLFDLGVDANIVGGATLAADIQVDNYKNYLGGSIATIPATGGPGPNLTSAVPADTRIDRLEVSTPFASLGRGSQLTLGRIHERLGHLTLWRPDTDVYFDNPFIDDGAYRMDGARLTTNFGSLFFEALGGQLSSVQGTDGFGPYNMPYAGSITGNNLFVNDAKPIGQVNQAQLGVNRLRQLVGVNFGMNLRQLNGGHVRLTALQGATDQSGTGFYNGVWILGGDVDLKIADHIVVNVDYGKVIPITGNSRVVSPHDDNAANSSIGYQSGNLTLTGGYRYVEPLYYAPGYWGRIGNWMNPTNIQGPVVRADYRMSSLLGITLGGDYYFPAKNRENAGGMGHSDYIYDGRAGLQWHFSKDVVFTTDWEGVFWHLTGFHSGLPAQGGGSTNAIEQYITFGTQYHLTSATSLALAYQLKAFDGKGSLFDSPFTGASDTAGIVTASASVRF